MTTYAPVVISDWCIVSQGLTTKHKGWEPCLGLRQLNVAPFWSSVEGMTGSLLLSWPVGLFFNGRTRSSRFHCFLALWFPSPFRVSLFNPEGWRWLRSARRRFRWGRRKFGLSRLPSFPPSWLAFQQLLKTALGFPLNTHIFRRILGWWELIKNFIVVSGQGEVHKTLFLFLLYLENGGEGGGGRCCSCWKGKTKW